MENDESICPYCKKPLSSNGECNNHDCPLKRGEKPNDSRIFIEPNLYTNTFDPTS